MLAAAAFSVAQLRTNGAPDCIICAELEKSLTEGLGLCFCPATVIVVESECVLSYQPETIEGRTRTVMEIGEAELFTGLIVSEPDCGWGSANADVPQARRPGVTGSVENICRLSAQSN